MREDGTIITTARFSTRQSKATSCNCGRPTQLKLLGNSRTCPGCRNASSRALSACDQSQSRCQTPARPRRRVWLGCAHDEADGVGKTGRRGCRARVPGSGGGSGSLDQNDTYTIDGGSYTPLEGVPLADSASSARLDEEIADAAKWWNQVALAWWSYPLIGAAASAVLAGLWASAGVRLVRRR